MRGYTFLFMGSNLCKISTYVIIPHLGHIMKTFFKKKKFEIQKHLAFKENHFLKKNTNICNLMTPYV